MEQTKAYLLKDRLFILKKRKRFQIVSKDFVNYLFYFLNI